MSKREQQKAATQQKLLNEAKRLFIEQGYEGTTTRQVATACGVSIGTVFAHFPDKVALLKAILFHDIERILTTVHDQLSPDTDAFTAYLIYARALYGFYSEHPPLSQALLANSLFQYAAFEEQLRGYIQELSGRLVLVDGCSQEDADTVAYNLMGNYFLVLMEGLASGNTKPEQWLHKLERLVGPLRDWVRASQSVLRRGESDKRS